MLAVPLIRNRVKLLRFDHTLGNIIPADLFLQKIQSEPPFHQVVSYTASHQTKRTACESCMAVAHHPQRR